MKRFYSVLGMLLVMMCVPMAMMAAEDHFNQMQNPQGPAQPQLQQTPFAGSLMPQLLSEAPLKTVEMAKPAASNLRKGAPKKVTSLSEIAGDYVMTYETLLSTAVDGGLAVNIAPVEGTDSIEITNFWSTGLKVRAKVDLATGKLSIPNQKLGTDATYGDYDLAFCTSSGKPNRDAELEGTINADGTLSISSWWGVFVVGKNSSDTYKDRYFCANHNTEFEKTNATMSQTLYNTKTASTSTSSYRVVVKQEATNVVTVKNFAGYGCTVEIVLNSDSTATIAQQAARLDATNGTWYTYFITKWKDGYAGIETYSTTITCNKAADNRTISWADWTLICSSYYLGAMTEGKVEADFDLTYPNISTTDWEGDGTEANPYKINTIDDFVKLANDVNSSTELNYGSGKAMYARVYLGKYFAVTNDIDMSTYRVTPVGADWNHRFAGTIDGQGHTLTGLKVSTGANGYAGLVGIADTVSVIKNLNFVNPDVKTSSYYAGVVAAWSLGTIENCNVTNGSVANNGATGAGGIAGIANIVKNCAVNGIEVTAAGGYGGGVAGQVNTLVSNCSVVNANIKASGVSDTYPSGGVVGSLYYGSAENCYFTGTLDGRYHDNLVLGGVAGVCYKGSIDQCFASGIILGYNTKAYVGGVVGTLYGSLTNSYSNANITSVSSRYVGGLAGYLVSWTGNDGTTQQPSVKDCYTASVVRAETYLYDTATERREVYGQLADGTTPVLQNVYYDTQMVDFKSTEFRSNSAELTAAAGPKGFDSSVWTFTEGNYPRLTASAESEAAKFSASLLLLDSSSSLKKVAKNAAIKKLGNTEAYFLSDNAKSQTGLFSSIVGDSLVISESFGADTLYLESAGVGSRYYILAVAPIPFEGTGSETDPFLIKTKDDLLTLATVTTQKKQLFPDTWFKITNDIDMENDTTFLGICTDADDAYNKFAGHIDGDGHTLHNMQIKGAVVWKVSPEEAGNASGYGEPNNNTGADGCKGWKGFIGRMDAQGSLKNLNIAADCNFDPLWATCSPLVGDNYGTIENCRNYADITAISCWVGGIAGQNQTGGVIRNCYNAGTITTGYMSAGGISGTNYGLIENCENAGDVYGLRLTSTFPKGATWQFKSCGGISGSTNGGRYVNCVNSGTVTADTQVGSITGTLPKASSSANYSNDMVNCVSYGQVFALDDNINVGAMGGTSLTVGEIKDNYYDGQITVYGAAGNSSREGMTAATTATLTSGQAMENFDASLWSFTEGEYPVLKQFADEALVKTTRRIMLKVSEGETVDDLHSPVTLGTNDDCTWTLKQATVFKIENGQLIAPATVTSVITDTLVATVGNVTKPFVVKSLPVNPLTGEGTAESPYLINNAADWNALADYIASCGDALTGKFVALTADIDFTDTQIKQFSYDLVTDFDGDLDGRGFTVKGIDVTTEANYTGGAFIALAKNSFVHDITFEGKASAKHTYLGGVVGELSGKLNNVVSRMSLTNTKNYTGGVVGIVRSGARLTNVVNEGEISSAGTYAAGVVGYSEKDVYYENCANKGTLTYTGTSADCYLSGFIGACYPDTIISCHNEGQLIVTDTSDKAGGVSGFIGNATASKEDGAYYIKDCYNTADVSSCWDNAGLILAVSSSGYSKFVMDGCYNTGNITSTYAKTKSGKYTAGLCMQYSSSSTYTNCWNSGTVKSDGPAFVGGVLGYFKGTFTDSTSTVIRNCYNTGEIISTTSNAGGVVASMTKYVTIDSCYNVGNMSGGYGLGGIVGTVSGNYTLIKNCWNAGNITTTANRCGGIYGTGAYGLSEVVNCFNVGDIVSTAETAKDSYGLGGMAGCGYGHFTNVYSTGHLEGLGRVGGLVGYGTKGTSTDNGISGTCIENAYFAGTITAPADSCGMIIGVNMTDNGKVWNENNVVKNVYYLADSKVECVDTVGIAISKADLTTLAIGSEWVSDEAYCYPTLASINDNDYARIHSIALIPGGDDTMQSITQSFYVGSPAGVTWTVSNEAATVNGNAVEFSQSYTGELELTATSGEVSKTFTVNCNVVVTGIDNVQSGKAVVSERFYTPSGIEVTAPHRGGKKNVYIVVRTYSDNTTQTVREVH